MNLYQNGLNFQLEYILDIDELASLIRSSKLQGPPVTIDFRDDIAVWVEGFS